MALESKPGVMVQSTQANGERTERMARVDSSMLMVTSTMDTGRTTKQMDEESTSTSMVRSMKVCGKMIFSTATAWKPGQTSRGMKAIMPLAANMESAAISGTMARCTLATGERTRSAVLVSTPG